MKKRFFKVFKVLTITSTLLLTIFILTIAIITTNMNYQLPEIINVELYDSNNHKYLSYSNGKKQSYVQLDDISPYLTKAFISIEDKRFYKHHGVDIIRMGGAVLKNLKSNKLSEGASTITQQYVRNLYLTTEKTWKRKINEILISLNIEKNYSKNEILEGYLYSIYLDHGIYGGEEASIYYFNKHAKDLTLEEAAAIASIPKGPTLYSPIKNPKNNKERRNLILREMLNDGLITNEEYEESSKTILKCVGNNPNDDAINAPYFQDLVLQELKKIPEISGKMAGGLKVYTTLNTELYTAINDSIQKRAPESDIETAIYAMEPSTGKV